jgi:aspartyl protease family protein
MRSVLVFAFLALALAVVAPRYLARMNEPAATDANASATAPPPAPATSPASAHNMTIERGPNGHFSVAATVDGRRIDFLVDTGASVIALREQDAGRLGIYPAARDYTVNVSTANGVVRGAPVELSMVEIGSLAVHDVAALVLPDEALGQNLLGMSFLQRVHWEYSNGRFTLDQ